LEEANAMQPGMVCCRLLAVILLTDEVAEPHLLWDQFKARLCDNVKHKLHHMNLYQADQEIPKDDIYDYGLWDLNRILVGMERSLADFPLMPLPQQQWAHRIPNPLLQAKQYNVDEMATLVDKQRAIVTNFIRSYLHQFFDDSHGLKASLKPLRRPFDRCQSRLEVINNGRDIKQINW